MMAGNSLRVAYEYYGSWSYDDHVVSYHISQPIRRTVIFSLEILEKK